MLSVFVAERAVRPLPPEQGQRVSAVRRSGATRAGDYPGAAGTNL